MRILVVGAGPAGLTLAHAFEQAGLHDFVILERRPEVVVPEGNTLGLWPHCVRILDQLGLLDEANKIKTNLTRSCFLAPDGTLLQENNMHDRIEANHGHRFQLFSRKDFVKMLYDNAPRPSERILTNKEIVSIHQDDTGVKINCGDGTSYEGDVLIGADGVRSMVRRQLFNEEKETMPFTAEFKAVYGIGPTLPGLRIGDIITTHGHGDSALAFVGEESTFWFVFVKRDGPTQRWSRYSKEQERELLDKYADVPLTSDGSVHISDLRRTAQYTKLVDLEEGIIPKWYQGRIALLGDAVHKMTPYVALGINTGIESAVVLTNELRKLGEDTSTEAIAMAFESYQQQRYERAQLCLSTSGNSCRMMCWPSWIVELVSRYVMPWFGAPLVARALAPIMRDSAVLDLVEEKNHKSGSMPWKFPRVEPYIKTG